MNKSQVKSIYISSPASTSSEQPEKILTGNLFIGNQNEFPNKAESVKIAFSINRRDHQWDISEWIDIINQKSITTGPKSTFLISRNDWIKTGLTWVISTPIFQKTPVKIVVDKNELLEPGFKVEIFTRDALIVREIPLSEDLATGVTITFEINWTAVSDSSSATPVVEPAGKI